MGSDCISSLNGLYQNSITDISDYITGSAISNTTTNTSSQNWITTNSGLGSNFSYIDTDDLVYRTPASYLTTLLTYLGEAEISEILDKILTRGTDNEREVKAFIREVVRSRHFSEDFVLKYFEHVTTADIKVQHNSDILSHDYPALALAIEGKEC
jgi:hypothetical protein